MPTARVLKRSDRRQERIARRARAARVLRQHWADAETGKKDESGCDRQVFRDHVSTTP